MQQFYNNNSIQMRRNNSWKTPWRVVRTSGIINEMKMKYCNATVEITRSWFGSQVSCSNHNPVLYTHSHKHACTS